MTPRRKRQDQTEAMNRLRLKHQLEAHALAAAETAQADYQAAVSALAAAETAQADYQAAVSALAAAETARTTVLAALTSVVGSPATAGELTGHPTATIAAAVKTTDPAAVDHLLGNWRRQVGAVTVGSEQ